MKAVIILLLLVLLTAVGCAPAPTSPSSASPSATEAATSHSPAPIITSPPAATLPGTTEASPVIPTSFPTKSVPAGTPPLTTMPEIEKPAVQFTWTIDQGVRLEEAAIPNIMRLEDGSFRLYYGGPGGILSAISQDGLSFTREAGVRISGGNDAAPIKLKDGRIRMYYKVATGSGGPGQAVHSIYSAISDDGLSFQDEGIRIDSQKMPDNGWASVPEAIVLPDGKVRIYYVSDGADVGHGIVSALSEDGLNFTREGPVLPGFVDPAVIKLPSGEYLLLASAFPNSKVKLTGITPGIYCFTSKDGINFTNRQLVLGGDGNIDPAIIEVETGTYRVYYWNTMDKPSVIRSTSGKLGL